jgi:hypothetical protein
MALKAGSYTYRYINQRTPGGSRRASPDHIKGKDKSVVLAKLYNASKVQGMGILQSDPSPMTAAYAQALLNEGNQYFDYLHGKVMKVDLSKDEFCPRLYDRDRPSIGSVVTEM